MSDDGGVLMPHGGYEHLRSYAVAEAVLGLPWSVPPGTIADA